MTTIRFFVPGTPVPQGSMRHVGHGRMIHGNDASLKPWRAALAAAAMEAMGDVAVSADPVTVTVTAYFLRPKCHYGTGRNNGHVKRSAPSLHTVKPDGDKLLRAVLDSLTGICYRDDSQVWRAVYSKQWVGEGHHGIDVTVGLGCNIAC